MFELSPPEFPPSEGWTGAASVVLASSIVTPTVTDDDQGTFTVTIAASQLSAIVVQTEARLVFRVTGGVGTDYAGQVYTPYAAPLTILPNVTGSTLTSSRSAAQIEYDAVTAAILAITQGTMAAYSIGGRAATKLDLPALYKRQAVLAAQINAEKGYGHRKRKVAFVGADC